ncbi:MAG: hypothetical protein ACYC5H_04495 [Methylovirgula sp.]
MIISDSAFWFLAFALYVFDNMKLIDGREILLLESMGFRIQPRLTQIPFEIKGRCLVILNPFLPFLMAFKAKWSLGEVNDLCSLKRDRRLILRLQRRVFQLRLIAALSFANLFIIGPVLARHIGLAPTLLKIALVHLALLLLLACSIAHDSMGLPARYWVLFILECIICPVYLPTLLKRLSWRSRLESDGIAFAKRYGPKDALPELQIALGVRAIESLPQCEGSEGKQNLENHLS